MAEYAYLQTAAAQLRQAVTALKQEASLIRSEAANHRRKLESDVANLELHKKGDQMRSMSNSIDSSLTARLQMEANKLGDSIADKRKEIDKITQESEQRARDKEAASMDLNNLASSLERFAGDPRLR